jgi:hypothetical protein
MFDYRSYWTIVEQKVRGLPMVVKAAAHTNPGDGRAAGGTSHQARCRMFGIQEGGGEHLAW